MHENHPITVASDTGRDAAPAATSLRMERVARRAGGGCFGWACLRAPVFRLRAGHCVPPPFRAQDPQAPEVRSSGGMVSQLLQIGGL